MKTEPYRRSRKPSYSTPDLLVKLVMALLLLALILIATGCSMPPIAIKVEGNYADYSYSAKSGLSIRPKIPVIAGRRITITPTK